MPLNNADRDSASLEQIASSIKVFSDEYVQDGTISISVDGIPDLGSVNVPELLEISNKLNIDYEGNNKTISELLIMILNGLTIT